MSFPSTLICLSTLRVLLVQFYPFFQYDFELLKEQIMREPIPSRPPLDQIIFMRSELLHGSVQVDTIPDSMNLLPIVREPDDARKSKAEFELSADVIIIEGFVKPISISE